MREVLLVKLLQSKVFLLLTQIVLQIPTYRLLSLRQLRGLKAVALILEYAYISLNSLKEADMLFTKTNKHVAINEATVYQLGVLCHVLGVYQVIYHLGEELGNLVKSGRLRDGHLVYRAVQFPVPIGQCLGLEPEIRRRHSMVDDGFELLSEFQLSFTILYQFWMLGLQCIRMHLLPEL